MRLLRATTKKRRDKKCVQFVNIATAKVATVAVNAVKQTYKLTKALYSALDLPFKR